MTLHTIQRFQGIYYALTGLWPWLHIQSFMAVTGPKTDLWLVQTVGALALVIGLALLAIPKSARTSRYALTLGLTAAAAFAFVDFYFSLSGVIAPIYQADGAVQVLLMLLTILFRKKE